MRTWSTLEHAAREQYPFWREVLCEAFTALDPVATSVETFASEVAIKDFVDVTVSDVASQEQTVVRGQAEIRRAPSDFFFANLQLKGTCRVIQDGRETLVRPGEFYLVDTTRVYDLVFKDTHCKDWRILCIRFPRRHLLSRLATPTECTARAIRNDNGIGTVTGNFMQSVLQSSESMPHVAKQTMLDALFDLIAVAAGATPDVQACSRATLRHEMYNTIVRYLKANASDPELSLGRVAARFRVSPRYVQKLFESSERPFSKTIAEIRLTRCAHEISDPGLHHRSISEIAQRAGFSDLSHCSRAFKAQFGVSAREFRRSVRKA